MPWKLALALSPNEQHRLKHSLHFHLLEPNESVHPNIIITSLYCNIVAIESIYHLLILDINYATDTDHRWAFFNWIPNLV